ncbi:hypothetical protein M011DRAFT_461495 [Sporormia fimetaria CBS 119925]|uniref:Uncharacterized protein n=1 Tax=Sporormia fimetaria CBS 119925 TaxID=1340428 RepID=A0A6A6V1P2_9PLEO|nr:hypothetical protein M011DRAFT_461495 [Sporormia fimetaria CBS 119925]
MAILRSLSLASILIATMPFFLSGATCRSVFLTSFDTLYRWYGGEQQAHLAPTPDLGNYYVGISLHPSYGAISILFENGTTVSQTVLGSSSYLETMHKLSLASSRHLAYVVLLLTFYALLKLPQSPPYQDLSDSLNDHTRVTARHARKALGLPASDDVGAIASIVPSLRDALSSSLGMSDVPISSAAVSVPHLVALYQDDVQDVLDYCKISYIEPDRYYRPLTWDTAATYAGYGLGLCTSWEDSEKCMEEEKEMQDHVVLAVNYGEAALTTAFSILSTATSLWEPDHRHRENFGLGAKQKDGFEGGEEGYWEAMKESLVETIVENPGYKKPEKILLSGERTGDERFLEVLKEAVRDVMGSVPEIYGHGAETVASRGVAEFAKRKRRSG